MRNPVHITLITALLLVGQPIAATFAETVVIPVGQQNTSHLRLPKKGTSKQAVIAEFGAPQTSTAAVGKPPISTLNYPEFSVYFEYDHVIHAVAKHKPVVVEPSQAAPADEPTDATESAEPTE